MRALITVLTVVLSAEVSASIRTITLRGTLNNSAELKALYPAVNLRSVGYLRPASGVDLSTGAFSGELDCELVRNAFGTWVDVVLEAFTHFAKDHPTMTIRVPYARTIDLGSFDWRPSHYRMKEGELVIDTAVPRDTLIGELWGDHVIMSPINPTPQDSIQLEFFWGSSGAPIEAAWSALYKEHWTLLDLTFAVRTDVDVYGDSWMQRARPIMLGRLAPGRYGIRQVPAQGEHLRDVDFLLNTMLSFTVGERHEP